VQLDEIQKQDLNVYVVPDNNMKVSAVLGRDVLKTFKLSLSNPSKLEKRLMKL